MAAIHGGWEEGCTRISSSKNKSSCDAAVCPLRSGRNHKCQAVTLHKQLVTLIGFHPHY